MKNKAIFCVCLAVLLGILSPWAGRAAAAAGYVYTVSVEFRPVEDKPAPGLLRAVNPKNGEAIYLRPEKLIVNADITDTQVVSDERWSEPTVEIRLSAMCALKFADYTAANIGKRLAILVDGVVVSAPMIQERIAGGKCLIKGGFTKPEAKRIAAGIMELKPAEAAVKNDQTPEEVARAYFAALQTQGMGATVDFMHPDALTQFKEMFLPLFEIEAGQQMLLETMFGKDATMDGVRKASPQEFYSVFIKFASAMAGTAEIRFDRIEVIGSIREGEITHVLCRIDSGVGDLSIGQMEVISLKKSGKEWRMLLNGKIAGIARALRMKADAKNNLDELDSNMKMDAKDDLGDWDF